MDANGPPPPLSQRRAILALLLSLLGAGIGHIYAGRGRRGVILMVLMLGYVPAVYLLSVVPAGAWVLYALLTLIVFEVGVVLYALVDSIVCARNADRPFHGRAYNHGGLYLALVALSLMWSVIGSEFTRDHAFEAFEIPTRSMEPTITLGDRILANKFQWDEAQRGDLVVFRAPGEGGRNFIKRVVGMPGEEIRVSGGSVTVDGKALPAEPVEPDEHGGGVFREHAGGRSYLIRRGGGRESDLRIPEGHVFVLGDNRANSHDSRQFGPVPLDDIVGIAQYIYSTRPGGTLFGPLD